MKNGLGRFYHMHTGQLQEGCWKDNICIKSKLTDIIIRQFCDLPTEYPIPPVSFLYINFYTAIYADVEYVMEMRAFLEEQNICRERCPSLHWFQSLFFEIDIKSTPKWEYLTRKVLFLLSFLTYLPPYKYSMWLNKKNTDLVQLLFNFATYLEIQFYLCVPSRLNGLHLDLYSKIKTMVYHHFNFKFLCYTYCRVFDDRKENLYFRNAEEQVLVATYTFLRKRV